MNHSQKSLWDKILTVVLTIITPFIVYGTITLIRDDLKINILWNTDFVDENRLMEIINLQNARNEILDVKYGNVEKDISIMMQDLRTINNRIDAVTNTTRSLRIDEYNKQSDTASLEDIMEKWKRK